VAAIRLWEVTMNTLLHDRASSTHLHRITMSRTARTVALLALLLFIAISVNAAVILADGTFHSSPSVGPAAYTSIDKGGQA
jgi:hypothetical protein